MQDERTIKRPRMDTVDNCMVGSMQRQNGRQKTEKIEDFNDEELPIGRELIMMMMIVLTYK